MGASNTYIYDTQDNLSAILPALLQNKGIDPTAAVAMMNNNKGGGFLGNNGLGDIIALIIVAAIFGNGNGGGIFGGGNNNSNAEREMLMQALNRNGVDIGQLAQAVNCSSSQILQAINQVSSSICGLGNQMGQNTNQIIMSIMQGNNALTSQIANCCCDLKQLISQSNYLTERGFCETNQILAKGFSDIGYSFRDQTCNIEKAIAASTQQILAGQAAIEKRELQREIATLQEEKQTYKLGNMIASATNPILNEIESIKCKLPRTEPVNVSPEYVPVNRSVNIAYQPYCANGFNPYAGFGFNGVPNGSLWG